MSPCRITKSFLGTRERNVARERVARFPSFFSERSSRPLGPRRNYAIVTDEAGWRLLPLEVHREVHAGEARVHPSKCTRSGDARCCISFPSREASVSLRREREREREDIHDFPCLNEGESRVRLDKGKGNQTKRSTPETREPLASAHQS